MLRSMRAAGGAPPAGCVMVEAAAEEEAAELICGGVLDWLQEGGYDLRSDVQVLSPLKRGAAGTQALNRRLKSRLNPESPPEHAGGPAGEPADSVRLEEAAPSVAGGGGEFYPSVDDSMIQLTNDYDQQVFNGDVGRVTQVWRDGRSFRFVVQFSGRSAISGGGAGRARASERCVEYTRSSLGTIIAPSYALTVHKAQGSEYPVVVMPILQQHRTMLYRNLLYTGFSRAKRLLVLVGNDDAIKAAVDNEVGTKRLTLLATRVHDRDFAPPTTRHMSEW